MKYLKITFLSLFFVSYANAGDISCSGKISMLMADHNSCKDSNGKKQLAFKLKGTQSWLCNGSDTASSLILSAKMADKTLSVYISDAGGATCGTHANYLKPSYSIIN